MPGTDGQPKQGAAFGTHPPLSTADGRRGSVAPVEILGLLVVPVEALGVYLLPVDLRTSLVFRYDDPGVVAAFASNYLHFSLAHLVTNLLGYLLVVPLAYLLSVSNGHRGRFWTVFATVALVLPVPLSYLNLAMPRTRAGFGMSGLVLALLGYALVELAAFVTARVTDEVRADDAPVLFFLATAFLSLPHTHVVWGRLTLGLSLLGVSLYAVRLVGSSPAFVRGLIALDDERGSVELLLTGVLGTFGLFLLAFPSDPASPSGRVNVYVHFLGFSIGFIATYVLDVTTTALEARESTPHHEG